jgi:hypothetical protein
MIMMLKDLASSASKKMRCSTFMTKTTLGYWFIARTLEGK